MRRTVRPATPLFALFVLAFAAVAAPAQQTGTDQMTIRVTVDSKSGDPVPGLTQNDFTLTDNRHPQPITAFRELKDTPTGIIIVLDAVNLPYTAVSYARQQLAQYLSANDGQLSQPTALGVLEDNGLQIQPQFATRGNELRAALDHFAIGLREIHQSSGIYGAEERLKISLNAFDGLVAARLNQGPTRIIWISPGWPLLSGPHVQLSEAQSNSIFNEVVGLTTQLRTAHIVVDMVNPAGAAENVGQAYYYENFLRAPKAAHDVEVGNIGLQVIATQSGGIVFNGSNDISGLIQRAVAQTKDVYELTFTPAPGDRPNEYHQLDVKLARPGLTAHTTTGYYARPVFPSHPPLTPATAAR